MHREILVCYFPSGDKKPTGHTHIPPVSLPLLLQITLELLKMEVNNKWPFLVKMLVMTNIEQCCCGRAPTTSWDQPLQSVSCHRQSQCDQPVTPVVAVVSGHTPASHS